ncbi:hypothetical protein SLA2020_495160 [Shorea laevis]
MASRPIVPRQPRGEAVVGGGGNLQKKNGAADARNRRALGDIGNLVTVRGIEGKPNRPITRSFCAQLLANAQAAAAAENNKKQVCVNVDGAPLLLDGVAAGKRAGAPKPHQKKVNVKPKPEEVIDISPDTQVEDIAKAKQENPVNKKKDGEGASRKKAAAFTSVLTARSKAAGGMTNKPKEQIVDIDAQDVGNDLAAVEYVEDIYKFYKLVEHESRPHDYMESQPEINESMRAILVDWLVDVHKKFDLSLETLYLTINIIDRFLAIKKVPRVELQLVGISAMLMASKYEEIWPPSDFVHLSDNAYSHEQVLASIPDHELESMVYFLAELGVMHYATIIYCPSMIAASAVYAARCTLKKTPAWNETLKLHTGFSEPQLMDCAKLLVSFHSMAGKSKLQSVYRKYSREERKAVALLSPAKALLPSALKTTV